MRFLSFGDFSIFEKLKIRRILGNEDLEEIAGNVFVGFSIFGEKYIEEKEMQVSCGAYCSARNYRKER